MTGFKKVVCSIYSQLLHVKIAYLHRFCGLSVGAQVCSHTQSQSPCLCRYESSRRCSGDTHLDLKGMKREAGICSKPSHNTNTDVTILRYITIAEINSYYLDSKGSCFPRLKNTFPLRRSLILNFVIHQIVEAWTMLEAVFMQQTTYQSKAMCNREKCHVVAACWP